MSRLIRTPGQVDAASRRLSCRQRLGKPVGCGRPDYAQGSPAPRTVIASSHATLARIGSEALAGTIHEVDARTIATDGTDSDRTWRHWSGSYRDSRRRRKQEQAVSEHVIQRHVPNEVGREWFARPSRQHMPIPGSLTGE